MQQQQQAQQQQIEMQRRQLADQDALTKAMTQYQVGTHSPDDLPGMIVSNGGSGQAALAAQQHLLQLKDTAAQIAQRDADTGSKNIETYTKRHDAGLGMIQAASQVDDSELGDHLDSALDQAQNGGLLRPDEIAHGRQLAQLAKQDPARARALLPAYENGFKTEKQIFEEAQKETQRKIEQQKADAAQWKQTGNDQLMNVATGEVKGTPRLPAAEQEFQAYYKSWLASHGQQPNARAEYNARQQYFKDKQPFGAARLEIAREGLDIRQANSDRQDINFIDKNYVKPANDAEKSYQMFMDAYNNRNNAKTGAESMLALSTHLATTFGNVKGARVTKDMIQEHLGARGITDRALVAVQRIVNGDNLSPDQWDAFKDLISNSRKLNWDNARKEADRRGVDISGSVPRDLGGAPSTGGGGFFEKFGGKPR